MRRKSLWFGVQAAMSVGLLVALFRRSDITAFVAVFARIPLWFYVGSLLVLGAGQLLYTGKWGLILRAMGVEVGFWRLAQQYMIGIFFNNFLPTGFGGDVARVYYLGRLRGYASVGTSVLLDRAMGFCFMTMWAMPLVWSIEATTPALVVTRDVLTALFAIFVAAAAAIVFLPLGALTSLLRRSRWLAPIGSALETLRTHASPLKRRPGTAAAVFAIVLLYFIIVAAVYVAYFRLAAGQITPFWPVVTVLMSIGILSNLPIAVNGIGLREQLHYLLFAGLGISKEVAVGISVIVFSQFLLLSLVGYLLWLQMRLADSLTARERLSPETAPMLDVVYDGQCVFCVRSLTVVRRLSRRNRFRFHDAGARDAIAAQFPALAGADLDDAMFVVTPRGQVFRGFFAFRRMMHVSPWLYPLVPLLYFPGASWVGPRLYAWVARNRHRFGCSVACEAIDPVIRSSDRGTD